MENNKNRFVIWLLIVIIILLATAVTVLFTKTVNENGTQIMEDTNISVNEQQKEEVKDKVVDNEKDTVENNPTNNTNEQENVVNKYGVKIPTDKDVHVYSYIDQQKVIEKGAFEDTNLTISLRIPQIKYDTEVARNINSDILNKFGDYIKAFDENKYETKKHLADVVLSVDYDYTYSISENRIYLNVIEGLGNSNASGYGDRYTYIYDVAKDKQITFTELLTEKGITAEKIIESLYKDYNFNLQYGNNAEAKQWAKDALNDNFSNVRFEKINVDKRFDNNKYITLGVFVYRDYYEITYGL